MITVRQLEAFFWVARLKSFADAAEHLHLSQSALSKRLAELESVLGQEVFDRSAYRLALTPFGKRLLERAGPVLTAFEDLHRLGDGDGELEGQLAFGLTELITLTWLPHGITQLRAQHPRIILEPHVDRSSALVQRIKRGQTGFAVVPVAAFDDDLRFTRVADVRFTLMASPALLAGSADFRVAHLAEHPVLTQAATSQAALLFDQWAINHGLHIHKVLATNSLTAVIQLVLAGLGIGFLPEGLCEPLVASGRLMKVGGLPPAQLTYYGVSPRKNAHPLHQAVESVMLASCDFSRSCYS